MRSKPLLRAARIAFLLLMVRPIFGLDDGVPITSTTEQRIVIDRDESQQPLPIDHVQEATVGFPAMVTIKDESNGISRIVAGALINDFRLKLHLDPWNNSETVQISGHLTIYAHDDDHDVWEMLPSDDKSDYQVEYTLQEMLNLLVDA